PVPPTHRAAFPWQFRDCLRVLRMVIATATFHTTQKVSHSRKRTPKHPSAGWGDEINSETPGRGYLLEISHRFLRKESDLYQLAVKYSLHSDVWVRTTLGIITAIRRERDIDRITATGPR